jgi:uncharacterized membrane protein
VFCTHCGGQIEEGAHFCPKCGSVVGGPGAFPGTPAGAPAGGGAPAPPMAWVAPVGCKAQTGKWIGGGWRLVQGQLLMFMVIAFVMTAVSSLVPFVLQGPMILGFHIVCWKVILGRRADFADLFKGFNYFVPALVAFILISLFTGLGVLACIVGALVVGAMFQFTYLFIVDRKMDFWPAMQASHDVVKQDYLGFTLFVLTLICVHILGLLACLIGVFVTIPIHYLAVTLAYQELVGFASEPPE